MMKNNNRANLVCILLCTIFLWSCKKTSSGAKEASLEKPDITRSLSKTDVDNLFKKTVLHLNNAWDSIEQTKRLPRSIERGFRHIGDWTSGFYPGNLWIAYEKTGNQNLLEKAKFATELLDEEKYNIRDHDIGFRIYCSYGRGYELTKKPEYKDVIVQAAKSAIQRYNPKVKAIMSWEPRPDRDWQYPVIIDNMMNLELLFAATKFTGDSKFYDIAVNHAIKTMEHQYREDFSCSHVVDFDAQTGEFRKRDWNNGNNDPSTAAWSRGQSWGLYGFTMVYRETKDKQFLEQAEKIAGFILNHPNMPKDMIPYWDYNAPEIPTLRDASAAAILASGLIELSQLSEDGEKYFEAGEKILNSLASPEYFAEPGTNGDFVLKHATGNYIRKSERDGTLIYADYYFLEGLMRYTKIKNQLM
ncbi:glycoside hydrolase family 88 protein [Flavivirga spongiicola]|uniref:Glycoside hydrolase family 88 protein n=1 Tax=Flavivirga spongiicola TaxID=421621 RepID=A0ABU7XX58_9FLAO|nr:glycoside hydrolase family 88 protein [Flavivirga sp. MEBiC05379]MDO5980040.1 glycoside hydrolase family 88 protein [Flavivirga sp. MEBiC05379]